MKAYIDGACKGNPGPGGWAVVFEDGTKLDGHFDGTTNNQMELTAAIKAVELAAPEADVELVTDSKNVIGWLHGWNMTTNRPDPAKRFKRKDPDVRLLAAEFDAVVSTKRLNVTFQKVEGHSGDPLNEWADRLASAACYS